MRRLGDVQGARRRHLVDPLRGREGRFTTAHRDGRPVADGRLRADVRHAGSAREASASPQGPRGEGIPKREGTRRVAVPAIIQGLWKADLFVGHVDSDRWVGTTVKTQASKLEAARGLRVGIVPSRSGSHEAVIRDEQKNLVVCPLPHDGAFMEIFYEGWGVVQQVLAADVQMPSEAALPRPAERYVPRLSSIDARIFGARRH